MKIKNKLNAIEYEIFIQNNCLKNFSDFFPISNKHILVVTDDGVPQEYSDVIVAQFNHAVKVCLPHGENSKCLKEYQHLVKVLQENNFNRGDCIVAVGGGVISDLCGFVASTYMRGIAFYSVPTTLLAQVDASVGGKNAINFNCIKNFLGTFYQPYGVLVDPFVLQTLDKRQLSSGFAELLKIAVACDKGLFSKLEMMEPFSEFTIDIISSGIEIKKNIVELDPFEQGARRVLNFGHTIGHAIESVADGELLHGECVSVGMLAFCSDEVRQRLIKVLQSWCLPICTDIETKKIRYYLEHDKKYYGHKIKVVYVDKIGSYEFKEETVDEIIQRMEKIR